MEGNGGGARCAFPPFPRLSSFRRVVSFSLFLSFVSTFLLRFLCVKTFPRSFKNKEKRFFLFPVSLSLITLSTAAAPLSHSLSFHLFFISFLFVLHTLHEGNSGKGRKRETKKTIKTRSFLFFFSIFLVLFLTLLLFLSL